MINNKYRLFAVIMLLFLCTACSRSPQKFNKTNIEIANNLFKEHKFEKALELYKEFIKKNPDAPDGYYGKANVLTYQHKFNEALEEYNKAIKIDPNFSPLVYMNRGTVLTELDRYDEAERDYNRAMEAMSEDSGIHFAFARLYSKKRNWNKVIEFCNKCIELEPASHYYAFLGQAYERTRDLDKAKENCLKALEMDPGNINAYAILAGVCVQSGDVEEASKLIDEALKTVPESPRENLNLYPQHKAQMFYLRGLIYTDLEQYDNSLKSLKKAIEMNPEASPPYLEMADIYRKVGDKEKAEKALKLWFKKTQSPKTSREYNNYGIAYHFANKPDESIKCFEKAISMEPGIPKPYSDRAKLYIELGEIELARKDLRKVIDIDRGVDREDAINLLKTLK